MENYVITFNSIDNGSNLDYGYETISGRTAHDALSTRFRRKFKRLTGDTARFAQVIIVKGEYDATANSIKHKGRYMRLCYEAETEYICETCISAIRSRGESIMQGIAVDVSDEPKECWWCKCTDEATLYTFTVGNASS